MQIKLNVEHLEQIAHTETGAAVKLSEQHSNISTREAIFALKLTSKVHTLFGFDRKAILKKATSDHFVFLCKICVTEKRMYSFQFYCQYPLINYLELLNFLGEQVIGVEGVVV